MKPENRILYLVRHAKAEKGSAGMADIDRPLHETGVTEANIIARKLFDEHEIPLTIISSPAARAVSTALIFQRVLRVPYEEFFINPRLYEIDINDLYEFIASIDDRHHSVMLFGHNPAFTMFANAMEPSVIHMPTGSVVKFEFNVEKWRHTSYINAEKKLFITP